MYASPFEKFLRRFLIVWIVAIVLVVVFLLIFVSPLSPFRYCTQIGCRDALQLNLAHEPPGQYTILISSSTGETRSVTCISGKNSATGSVDALCRTGIVTIYGFTPTEVTVQVTWQGGNYTSTIRPEYTSLHPNGLFCPPTCRLGKLHLQLP